MHCPRAFKHHIAARCRNGKRKRARLNAIRHNRMNRTFEPVATLNAQHRRADAFNLYAHFDEALGHVADLRFARRIFDNGFALGENCRQQHLMRRADRHLRENDMRAAQSLRGLGNHVTGFDVDFGAELFKARQMHIDGAGDTLA